MRAFPDSSLIDRLVRGRAWIPALGVMLAGIVAMQVEVLKLGSSLGRWVERSSALTQRNQQLRGTVAALADDQRIESLAAGMGMLMPPPSALGFLSIHGATVGTALGHIHSPDGAQFLATLPQAGQPAAPGSSSALAAVAQGPAAPASSSASPPSGAQSQSATTSAQTSATAAGARSSSSSSAPGPGSAAAPPPASGATGGAAVTPASDGTHSAGG